MAAKNKKEECRKCGIINDRQGWYCRKCKYEAMTYNDIRQGLETTKIREDFRRDMPELFEEIRQKVLKDLEYEEKNGI